MSIKITKDIQLENIADVFDGEFPNFHPSSYFRNRLEEQSVLLAKSDNHNAGFLCYTTLWGNTPMIELIKVNEKYQRQGIGTKLLKEAAKEINKRTSTTTLVSSSEVINDMGNNFHKKMGFQPLNTLSMYHGEEQFYNINLQDLEKNAQTH